MSSLVSTRLLDDSHGSPAARQPALAHSPAATMPAIGAAPAPRAARPTRRLSAGSAAEVSRAGIAGRTATVPHASRSSGKEAARLPSVDRFAQSSFASLAYARSRFGPPTARVGTHDYCRVTWRAAGLTVIVNRVGSADPCRSGRAVGAVVVGRAWRTAAGLGIGQSAGALLRLYPAATSHPGGWWWLVLSSREILGRPHLEPTLVAHVSGGRVDSLVAG